MAELTSIILAAGQGTRMNSSLPKVLHPLLGRPMLQYIVDASIKVGSSRTIVVVGFEGQQVIDTIDQGHGLGQGQAQAQAHDLQYVWQKQQLGTGHAVMMAQEILSKVDGDLLVLYGDTPLLRAETIQELLKTKRTQQAAAAVLTTQLVEPKGFGRIIRNSAGTIQGIIEEKDASTEERKITEVNTGVYCFEIPLLLKALHEITPRNAQGEYYLTDVIKVMAGKGLRVIGVVTAAAEEVMGPNDRIQLAQTENFLKQAINQRWMSSGVTIQDPSFTYIGPEVEIGRDTTVLPGTFLQGKTIIGEHCIIGPHTKIIDSVIEHHTTVQFSQIVQAHLGPENNVGPYTYVRPGTVSAAKVKIGDFVEIKNCQIGIGTKVPHLTYLGDSELGAGVNIGAGTITCNYDGVSKHRTVIKDGAFIGSNANLVAPVTIGEKATIGAGSTITKEVPDNALAVARSKQEVKTGWRSPREREK
ncbi:MAG TPA: bifunctional UDP-N-acetylglucosamine diphosphorylase/glucosamine-1-phosphate N-acetyltransferase GlmU [Firmicutes bacterium]|nr:bifunctional UDP-N-acetylglucosamine diphosphorylase/glucosamine-1-phosphate N-acetyltransferase GlmU [Bacillota bacterium]